MCIRDRSSSTSDISPSTARTAPTRGPSRSHRTARRSVPFRARRNSRANRASEPDLDYRYVTRYIRRRTHDGTVCRAWRTRRACGCSVETGSVREFQDGRSSHGAPQYSEGRHTTHGPARAHGGGRAVTTGGAAGLLDADFVSNQPELEPEFVYRTNDGILEASITQPSGHLVMPTPHMRYEWHLHCADNVPATIDLEAGAGTTDIDLSTVPVLSLIHISEPTRLGMISYAVFCLK